MKKVLLIGLLIGQLLPQSFLKSCTNLFSSFNKKTVSSGEIVMLATTCDKEFCVFDEKFETHGSTQVKKTL